MDLSKEVDDIFLEDDIDRFVLTMDREFKENGKLMIDGHVDWPESEMLFIACKYDALKCAAAILDGKTPIKLDLNTPDEFGRYALHTAAQNASAQAVGFLLSRGARTDIRGHGIFRCENFKYEEKLLPLQLILGETCFFGELKSWNQDPYVFEHTSMALCKQPKQQSVFMLVTILCLPRMEDRLSVLRVLAWSTKETEELFLEFVRRGEVVKISALLAVAHKKLMSKDVLSDAVKKAAIPPVQQLFDVFERAGDAIDEYRGQKKNGEAIEQTVDFVAKLLEQSGFVFDLEDVDITIYRWASYVAAEEQEEREEWDYGIFGGSSTWKNLKRSRKTSLTEIFMAMSVDLFSFNIPYRLIEPPSDEREEMLRMMRMMRMKMGGRPKGNVLAMLSRGMHNIWTTTMPSSESHGSYNTPWLINSSTISSTKPKPSWVHNIWTGIRPSSQSQGSYNGPWLTNSTIVSSTKPKPSWVPSLSSSFSSMPWMPSLSSFFKGFGRRV